MSLNWLTRRDEGLYRCQVWSLQGNGSVVASAAVQLSVRGKPHIETHSPLEVHAVVGRPLSLHCRATGRPAPTVSWFREESPIKRTHSLFRLRESAEGSFLEVTQATEVRWQSYCHC